MSDIDLTKLQREFDQVVAAVFKRGDAAFYGPLLCALDFQWDYSAPTAQTDGKVLQWNPEDFIKCTPEERAATVMHELKHVAKMHNLRRNGRDGKKWNCACDLNINSELVDDGYKIADSPMFIYDKNMGKKAEEEIYKLLPPSPPQGGGGSGSGTGPGQGGVRCNHAAMADKMNQTAMINNLTMAAQSAVLAGKPGAIPGNMQEMISEFLTPVVPWEVMLLEWMTDLLDRDYTWARPNRRYPEMYLPSMQEEDGRLEELRYYIDTSESISKNDLIRFNSEVKYVWEHLRPKKLVIVMFDTKIHETIEFKEGDEFDKIKIVGRGGTDLREVREDIIKHSPVAAIIFTDLHVTPMVPLPVEIPILWICTNHKGAKVPFGKILHVDTSTKKGVI